MTEEYFLTFFKKNLFEKTGEDIDIIYVFQDRRENASLARFMDSKNNLYEISGELFYSIIEDLQKSIKS